MPSFVQALLLNVQFFTRIPLPEVLARKIEFTPHKMQAAFAYMPVSGWIVGTFSALTFYAALWACSASALTGPAGTVLVMLAATLSTAASIWLTGGLHEDGLADVADALGGYASAQRALQIMKDSCLGSYAVLTTSIVLLLKVCLLAALALLHQPMLIYALLAAHVVSRFFPLLLTHCLAHVALEDHSKTQQIAGKISAVPLLPAALCCLPLGAFFYWPNGLYVLVNLAISSMAAGLATLYMARMFKRRINGFTGDCLGATQQVCELVFYASALLVAMHGIGE